jgi:hypothetical protein
MAIGQQQWANNDVMAMGSQQHEEQLHVLHNPFKATIN